MLLAPRKILVVRNDRLGDFVLAYPTFLLLKEALPQAAIHALVPEYTREMAEACAGIDAVMIDPGQQAGSADQLHLLRQIAGERYDAILTLYSTTRIGLLAFLARVPYRLGPATKLAQVFYNRRCNQRRSRSAKPEHEYNLDLGLKLLSDFGIASAAKPAPFLRFPDGEIEALGRGFRRERRIPPDHRLIFVHPGSGGSANNLRVRQYGNLVRGLRSVRPFTAVITAGPNEEAGTAKLEELLTGVNRTTYRSTQGLQAFAKHIQLCDLFISGSTGPLHIAGALDRPTAGFYTRRRSATSLRWQTLNSANRRLAFSPPPGRDTEDMSAVDIDAAADEISRMFLSD